MTEELEAAKRNLEEIQPPSLPPRAVPAEAKLPPILDAGRRTEVIAMATQILGSVLITAIGLFAILVVRGQWDWSFFLVLLMLNAKDPLVQLVAFLTGAQTAKVELKRKREKEQWEEEKEELRQALTLANIELEKVRAEARIREEMLTSLPPRPRDE